MLRIVIGDSLMCPIEISALSYNVFSFIIGETTLHTVLRFVTYTKDARALTFVSSTFQK